MDEADTYTQAAFGQDIKAMNIMYRLPPVSFSELPLRMALFSATMVDELNEFDTFVHINGRMRDVSNPATRNTKLVGQWDTGFVLVDIMDWLGDICVYCASELVKIHDKYIFECFRALNDGPSNSPEAVTVSQTYTILQACQQSLRQRLYKTIGTTKLLKVSEELLAMMEATHRTCEIFGIGLTPILQIIMESNKSKLGADGQPIYDGNGKFLKGPNYWKPEPKIRALLKERGLID